MKNITKEKPSTKLHGRTLYSAQLMKNEDIVKKKILDIGCGYGWSILYSLKKGAASITGTELSLKDLNTAKKHISNKKVSLTTTPDITKLPFHNEEFDTITCWETIEHMPRKKLSAFFKEIQRILKPNGTMYLSTPYHTAFNTFMDPAWHLINHQHFSKKAITALTQKNKLTIESFHTQGGMWAIIELYVLYISKWIFKKPMPWKTTFEKISDKDYKKPGFFTLFVVIKKI